MRPKEIKKLIELVEGSSINELEVSRYGKKVSIRKNLGNVVVASSSETAAVAPPQAMPAVEAKAPVPQPKDTETAKQEGETNVFEIKSPMVGTFYRSPSPETDPYIQEGDIVTANQVLCIIEAMKLMNEIESEVRGRIVEILAENGKPVEYDQVLFKIEKL
ncbi:acetyl-CoA carboxylase biotin carboxyl carrier protein [candidate division KSB1 bacterium]|nr:acetyl-CoA carboxylase biotin carboxyl carrier protein [candidate division KSB1 bacterium]MBL7094045.1 acetyl-CoA carboxylase biotin carboxyl carrier protein [candidate division KSB1 bacterium]